MSFLRSIFKRFDGSSDRRSAYLDLIILAGLRENVLSDRALDQIAFLIQTQAELESMTWAEVEQRVAVIQASDLNLNQRLTQLNTMLPKAEHKSLALQMATNMMFDTDRESSINFLDKVADELRVARGVRADLLTPWSSVNSGTQSFRRCAYNNPDAIRHESLFEAIAHAENEVELALLTYKLAATRNALVHLGQDVQISGLGETLELPSGGILRIDAFLSGESGNWLSRFVGTKEALHKAEFQLIAELLEDLDDNAQIFVGHAGQFSVRDLAKLEAINTDRIHIEFISV